MYSVVPGAKSPNRDGILEFRPEFRRNLQPSLQANIEPDFWRLCVLMPTKKVQQRSKIREQRKMTEYQKT
jgi:hypothetical protein